MALEPTHPPTTTPVPYEGRLLHPPATTHPPILPAPLPPGVELVTLPSGARVLAYTQPTAPAPLPAPAVPAWAKTTALLAPTVGGGIAAAGYGITYAAPGLIALTETLWAAIALIATGAGAALLARRPGRRAGVTHITQHVTATGWFGRASGTITHR
ncbi:hypothetical protein [Streptomyces bambusae]|uniref:Uncharacterized protein n=1 Tax=Streptomyces bambusae TaxID=1550616 RepID=A0ABS6ZBY2_9ACTN|nr:hypothetical protein [Streptomyces bambusae]MBW5485269.1 hypothetical protein [Streptomyces bambusae]